MGRPGNLEFLFFFVVRRLEPAKLAPGEPFYQKIGPALVEVCLYPAIRSGCQAARGEWAVAGYRLLGVLEYDNQDRDDE